MNSWRSKTLVWIVFFICTLAGSPAPAADEYVCARIVSLYGNQDPFAAMDHFDRVLTQILALGSGDDDGENALDDLLESYSVSGGYGFQKAIEVWSDRNRWPIWNEDTIPVARALCESAINTLVQSPRLGAWSEVRGTPAQLADATLRQKLEPLLDLLRNDGPHADYAYIIELMLAWPARRKSLLNDPDQMDALLERSGVLMLPGFRTVVYELRQTPHQIFLLEALHDRLVLERDEKTWEFLAITTTQIFQQVMADSGLRAELLVSPAGEKISNRGFNLKPQNFSDLKKAPPITWPNVGTYRETLRALNQAMN